MTSVRRAGALLLALLLAGSCLPGALAQTTPTPTFTKESYSAFQHQLDGGQITAVEFNKKPHSLHITLSDGRLMLAYYPPLQFKSVESAIKAKGVPVSIEKVKVASKPVHHKLRYIAAGVLIVVIIVIALVLGFNRRRPEAGRPASAEAQGPPAT